MFVCVRASMCVSSARFMSILCKLHTLTFNDMNVEFLSFDSVN